MSHLNMLQEKIKEQEGFIISTDTLKLSDLIPEASYLIHAYDLDPDFLPELDEIMFYHVERDRFEFEDMVNRGELNRFEFEEMVDRGELREKAEWLWNESIFNYFNEIAPDGYYFGNTEGDGALFGFFQIISDD